MSETGTLIAYGTGPDHFENLSVQAVNRWDELEKCATALWKTGSSESRGTAQKLKGCLGKLLAVMLQGYRLHTAHDQLIQVVAANQHQAREYFAKPTESSHPSPMYGAYRGDIACADFENLLFQSRAALDCLTALVARTFKDTSRSYKKLANVLRNVQATDSRASGILNVMQLSERAFPDLLISETTLSGLRDIAAHGESLSGLTEKCFNFHFLTPRRVLVGDCELREFPVFRTSVELLQHVAHLVLNTLGLLVGKEPIDFQEFECTWANRTVVLSEFVKPEEDGVPLQESHLHIIKRMTPEGCETEWRNVDEDVFEFAIDISEYGQ